jgi:serine phosphatase RsbU (regulator of sigma subunit)
MQNIKIRNTQVSPPADASTVATAKVHRSHAPALEPLAVLEKDCYVPLPTGNPGLIGYTPAASQCLSQGFSVCEDPTTLGSRASHASISPKGPQMEKNKAARLAAKRRRANEMAIAREVQRKLLPQHMPPLETLDYAGSCEPAWTIGGDYYDFLDKGKGRVGFVLADVSGKGVFAALLMANLQASVRSQYVVAFEDLEELFRSVNKLFYESVASGFYATLFFADYFDATRSLRYVNCGHNPAFLVRADGICEKLGATATVLGMAEKWDCTVGEATISPGDILVVYSDGVTEAQSKSGEFFGDERLLAAVQANASLPAAGLVEAIAAAARTFAGEEQEDDLTLLVARANGTRRER